jgi:hypothetical protein
VTNYAIEEVDRAVATARAILNRTGELGHDVILHDFASVGLLKRLAAAAGYGMLPKDAKTGMVEYPSELVSGALRPFPGSTIVINQGGQGPSGANGQPSALAGPSPAPSPVASQPATSPAEPAPTISPKASGLPAWAKAALLATAGIGLPIGGAAVNSWLNHAAPVKAISPAPTDAHQPPPAATPVVSPAVTPAATPADQYQLHLVPPEKGTDG